MDVRSTVFVYMPQKHWPTAEVSKECSKVQAVSQLQNIAVMLQQPIDCKRFSKWRRLIRVTAGMVGFVDNLKAKVIDGRTESQSNDKKMIVLHQMSYKKQNYCG